MSALDLTTLTDVPEHYATQILQLWRTATLAATRGLDPTAQAAAERAATRKITTRAGQIASHAVRLHGLDLIDEYGDDAPAWAYDLEDAAPALQHYQTDAHQDQRIGAGLRLRRAPSRGADREWMLQVAAWLMSSTDDHAVTAKLCRTVMHSDTLSAHLAPAWWAACGARVARDLAPAWPQSGQAGRAWGDDVAVRAQQRDVAVRVASGRHLTKKGIAELVGVSRPTLDTWLREDQP